MKKYLLTLSAAASLAASAQTVAPTAPISVWDSYGPMFTADRALFYDTDAQGKSLPILWGFDTAWNDRGNMLRGLRHSGRETVGVARVSFQPWDVICLLYTSPSTRD